MSSNTLDELGRAVLDAVEGRRVRVGTLESELDAGRAEIDDRLAQLVDNGLVREVGEDAGADTASEAEGYELTENGLRLLNSTPVGARDNRIDTPANVDRAIVDVDLRPDEEAAVRNAFSFLRYWGEATTAEIVDAAYSEGPAGYETADRWWDDCVRERLAALPDVRVVADEPIAGAENWIYDGAAIVEQPGDEDGRAIDDRAGFPSPAGSARHAIERTDPNDDDRAIARAAFAVLFDRGRATTDELVAAVDADRPPEDSNEAPADGLAVLLEEIPGVDRETSGDGEVVWVYDPTGGVDSS